MFNINTTFNETYFKNDILECFGGELQEHRVGKRVVLIFREGMQEILKERLKDRDYSEDARTLRKAAQIIRHDIFEFVAPKFSGSFTADCHENSVPTTLKTLVSMLLYGNSIKNKEKKDTQATLSIAMPNLCFPIARKEYQLILNN